MYEIYVYPDMEIYDSENGGVPSNKSDDYVTVSAHTTVAELDTHFTAVEIQKIFAYYAGQV
jgi:hypothetical protein